MKNSTIIIGGILSVIGLGAIAVYLQKPKVSDLTIDMNKVLSYTFKGQRLTHTLYKNLATSSMVDGIKVEVQDHGGSLEAGANIFPLIEFRYTNSATGEFIHGISLSLSEMIAAAKKGGWKIVG